MEKELADLLNKYSRENASNTPDFLLAEYLMDCLRAYERVVEQNRRWHGGEGNK